MRLVRKNLALTAIIILLIAVAGAANNTEQVFRIEFTVYDNHTFTSLEADTVEGSEYNPLSANERFERYDFEFRDGDGNILHREEVYVDFPEHSPLGEIEGPTMSSKYIQIPVIRDAEGLQVTHQGDELATIDLVDNICYPDSTMGCDPFCGNHGAGQGCTGETSRNSASQDNMDGGNILWHPIVLILILIGLILLILGSYALYVKQTGDTDQRTTW